MSWVPHCVVHFGVRSIIFLVLFFYYVLYWSVFNVCEFLVIYILNLPSSYFSFYSSFYVMLLVFRPYFLLFLRLFVNLKYFSLSSLKFQHMYLSRLLFSSSQLTTLFDLDNFIFIFDYDFSYHYLYPYFFYFMRLFDTYPFFRVFSGNSFSSFILNLPVNISDA